MVVSLADWGARKAIQFEIKSNSSFHESVYGLQSKNIWRNLMNPGRFVTGSVHYIHLADPSQEVKSSCDEPRITTPSSVHYIHLADPSEECTDNSDEPRIEMLEHPFIILSDKSADN